MKKTVFLNLIILTLCVYSMSSCDDILSTEERAEKAAAETCECLKKKSRSKCEDELNSGYKYYVNDDDFIKAFNNAQTCGITIYKKD
ncbi:MAG: hypothetical protein LBV74_00825 [Tannerella sp.]|jgi:hypothetical protein|nr:hypothetical protein [Tannerella sp.]